MKSIKVLVVFCFLAIATSCGGYYGNYGPNTPYNPQNIQTAGFGYVHGYEIGFSQITVNSQTGPLYWWIMTMCITDNQKYPIGSFTVVFKNQMDVATIQMLAMSNLIRVTVRYDFIPELGQNGLLYLGNAAGLPQYNSSGSLPPTPCEYFGRSCSTVHIADIHGTSNYTKNTGYSINPTDRKQITDGLYFNEINHDEFENWRIDMEQTEKDSLWIPAEELAKQYQK